MQLHHTALIAALLVGCGSTHEGFVEDTGVAPPRHLGTLTMVPTDLSTGPELSTSPVFLVAVVEPTITFEARYAAILEATVVLQTYPGALNVPVTPTFEALGSSHYSVSFTPSGPLRPGWYQAILDVSRIPSELDVANPSPRFYVGSLPLLSLTASADGAGSTTPVRLTVQGSERLVLASGTDVLSLIEVSGAATGRCRAGGADTPESELAVAGRTDLLCDGVSLDEALTVRIHPGLESPQGVPLRDAQAHTDMTVTWTPSTDGPMAPRNPSSALFEIVAP